MIRQLWLLAGLVLVAHTANAINEDYGYRELSQPDGKHFHSTSVQRRIRVVHDDHGRICDTELNGRDLLLRQI